MCVCVCVCLCLCFIIMIMKYRILFTYGIVIVDENFLPRRYIFDAFYSRNKTKPDNIKIICAFLFLKQGEKEKREKISNKIITLDGQREHISH